MAAKPRTVEALVNTAKVSGCFRSSASRSGHRQAHTPYHTGAAPRSPPPALCSAPPGAPGYPALPAAAKPRRRVPIERPGRRPGAAVIDLGHQVGKNRAFEAPPRSPGRWPPASPGQGLRMSRPEARASQKQLHPPAAGEYQPGRLLQLGEEVLPTGDSLQRNRGNGRNLQHLRPQGPEPGRQGPRPLPGPRHHRPASKEGQLLPPGKPLLTGAHAAHHNDRRGGLDARLRPTARQGSPGCPPQTAGGRGPPAPGPPPGSQETFLPPEAPGRSPAGAVRPMRNTRVPPVSARGPEGRLQRDALALVPGDDAPGQ